LSEFRVPTLAAEKSGKDGASILSGRGRRIPARLAKELVAHLYPQPRVAHGLWLREKKLATAAIDLSDGLSTDLAHLCKESGVAAEMDAGALPLGLGATLEQALHGGEDYELLFTAPAGRRVPEMVEGVAITRIGRMVRGRPTVRLLEDGRARELKPAGWEHFV
jgi:thiamine-monophosphate kinase